MYLFLLDTTTASNIEMSTLRWNKINGVNQIEDEYNDLLQFRDEKAVLMILNRL